MHLLYYGFLLLLDIFTAGAVYAPTPDIGVIFTDEEMQEECIRYTTLDDDYEEEAGRSERLKKDELCRLYAGIRHGLTVRAWCMENAELLQGVDVRRFITFGVIKGFLYRVHKYAVAITQETNMASGFSTPKWAQVDVDVVAAAATRVSTANGGRDAERERLNGGDESAQSSTPTGLVKKELPIADFLDGMHSFDEICTVLEVDEKAVLERMKDQGEIQLVYR